jgi:surface polysaccharide O-acyltransferase-like enzyme
MLFMTNVSKSPRVLWLDVLRVVACFLVVMVHAASGYFFNFQSSAEHFWGNFYGSFARTGVPLFVLISGVLLLPVKQTTTNFIKRRFTRVFFPFVLWSIIYVVIGYISEGNEVKSLVFNILKLPFQFPENGLHLWYFYVLLGLYLLIPIISPWLASASKREELLFLSIWAFSMLVPFVRKAFPQPFGEASWNDFGTFYYFSGYIGFLVLGHFLYKYNNLKRNASISLGVMLFLIGYILTFVGQQYIFIHKGGFSYQVWGFTSLNVAFMVVAFYLCIKNIHIENTKIKRAIIELSDMSFGVFFVHYFIVYQLHGLIYQLKIIPVIAISLNTIVSFVLSFVVVKLISFLPWKKYLIG